MKDCRGDLLGRVRRGLASDQERTAFEAHLSSCESCRLLCDVSNVVVSGHNMGYDAVDYLASLPRGAVAQLHLGGFTLEDDESIPGGTLLVDTHASAIAAPAWELFALAIERFGPAPTLIEWDNDLPPFERLLAEAARADAIVAAVSRPEVGHAAAR